ncbi:hypothetical protein PVAND_001959 [Polypedilum vanderplanki]|uniref:Ig-like domain-containing protein n=1 Tax=Polypedilum vanderplanki TaxID=319348 RepID=A0A9J6BQY0_POLVA|nr:hypothetical protein PVAND_001959 [Polypedilum vanderplanki]
MLVSTMMISGDGKRWKTVPTAFILGGPEFFISKILSFDSEPRLSQFTENGETFTNYIFIKDVSANDSGKYTCAPSNAEPSSIMVSRNGNENVHLIYY